MAPNRQLELLRAPAQASRRDRVTALSIVLTGDEPPSEFRIFTAGVVDTVKGEFVFDDEAAASVLAEYHAHGTELMVDYDHASLGSSADPALAGRAAGWFALEVRNGELWAVNVRWTPPAHEALRRKEWRYMSPAFSTDGDRIVSIMNVALTNLPATRRLDPLMAANQIKLGESAMSVEEFIKVCKALGIDMSASLEEAMAKIKGEPAAEEKKDAEEKKPEPPAEVKPMADAPAPPAEEDKPEEVATALSVIQKLSGKASFVASVADIRTWHASHVELETERQKLSAERKTLESAERRKGCVDMVVALARKPAEVWADDSATDPKAYLMAMPIADFRAYVAAALGAKPKAPAKAPAGSAAPGDDGPLDAHGLSKRDLKICKDSGCDPAVYASLKAAREAAKKT